MEQSSSKHSPIVFYCFFHFSHHLLPLLSLSFSLSLPQPARTSSGAAIALFTANRHSPLSASHTTTLQGIVYQLDCALQDTETQRAGLVFIYDMSGSKYSNFDYDLSQKILTLLKVSLSLFFVFKFIFYCILWGGGINCDRALLKAACRVYRVVLCVCTKRSQKIRKIQHTVQ